MPRKGRTPNNRNKNKNRKKSIKKPRNNNNNTAAAPKKSCYRIKNPWHDVVAGDLAKFSLFRKENISNSQKKKWCKNVKKMKKEGYQCVKAADSNNKWNITSWDGECN